MGRQRSRTAQGADNVLWNRIEARLSTQPGSQQASVEEVAAEIISFLRIAACPVRLDGQPARLDATVEVGGVPVASTWDGPADGPVPGLRGWTEHVPLRFGGVTVNLYAPRDLVPRLTQLCNRVFKRRDHVLAGPRPSYRLDRAGAGRPRSADERVGAIGTLARAENRKVRLLLENELRVELNATWLDAWILLPEDGGRLVTFDVSDEKLHSLYDEYVQRAGEGASVAALLDRIRPRAESTRQKAEAWEAMRSRLVSTTGLKWEASEPLSPRHLSSLRRYFRGWPTDIGIVRNVVRTGCAEVVERFMDDPRVRSYVDEDRGTGEFLDTTLVEPAFIKWRQHIIEIPMLWSAGDPPRVGAVLMVFFDARDPKDFRDAAIRVRTAVERWYPLLGLQAQIESEAKHRSTASRVGNAPYHAASDTPGSFV